MASHPCCSQRRDARRGSRQRRERKCDRQDPPIVEGQLCGGEEEGCPACDRRDVDGARGAQADGQRRNGGQEQDGQDVRPPVGRRGAATREASCRSRSPAPPVPPCDRRRPRASRARLGSAAGLPTTRTLPEKVPGGTRPSSTSSADIRGMFPGGPRKSIHVVRSLCAPSARRDAVGSSSTCCPRGPGRTTSAVAKANVFTSVSRGRPRHQLKPDGRARPGSRRADCRRPHRRADRRSPFSRPSRSGRPEIRRDWHGAPALPSASSTTL